MAAASRMLIPRLVSAAAALRVCSMARRSASRAWSRAWRACSTVLPGGLGQHWAGDELDRGFVGLEPQGGCFAHPGEGLVDGLAPGVDPWFFVELDRPAPVVLSFESGGVGLHVVLRQLVSVSLLIW